MPRMCSHCKYPYDYYPPPYEYLQTGTHIDTLPIEYGYTPPPPERGVAEIPPIWWEHRDGYRSPPHYWTSPVEEDFILTVAQLAWEESGIKSTHNARRRYIKSTLPKVTADDCSHALMITQPTPATKERSMLWKTQAEKYCREELDVPSVHQDKQFLYNLQNFGDDDTVALFDEDGFLVIQISDLNRTWGPGYFPGGIRAYPDYLNKETFLRLYHLADNIKYSVAASGTPTNTVNPDRSASDKVTLLLIHLWERQGKNCLICGTHIDLEESNPMLKIARGMIDSNKKTYDHTNTMIGHYGCILAKNQFSMEQAKEWVQKTRT